MDKEGLKILALYALGPKLKNACGFKVKKEFLLKIIEGKLKEKDLVKAEKYFFSFEVFPPYLKTLSKENLKDIFSKEIQEAYWLGNNLLKNCPTEKLKKSLKEHFESLGLEKKLIKKFLHLPEGALPHHSTSVLWSFYTPKNPYLPQIPIKRREKCLVLWGKILEIKNNHLIVKSPVLKQKQGKWFLGEEEKKKVFWKIDNFPLLKNPQKNQFVSIHQDLAVQVLSQEQLSNLQKWTKYHLAL